jgi:hypothetical protein
MATKTSYANVQVTGYTRLNNSVNGNPRYILHTVEDGDWTTQSDSGCNYEVRNDFDRATEAKPVAATLHTTPAHKVFNWELKGN